MQKKSCIFEAWIGSNSDPRISSSWTEHRATRLFEKKIYVTKKILISGRGGQSALRFARLRMEKRHNYVRKVAEVATQLYITNDKPNIAGLILAGSADFKTELSQSDMFDPVSKILFRKIFFRRSHFPLFYYVTDDGLAKAKSF